ncbi:MAG: hypothetical protein NTV80_08865 [Verrucomicrobia bacterium]|nr:hypothetical protein [Verrucomicrobiota bacterium]
MKKNILRATVVLIFFSVVGWHLGRPVFQKKHSDDLMTSEQTQHVLEADSISKIRAIEAIQETEKSEKKRTWLVAPVSRHEANILAAAGQAGMADGAIARESQKEDPEYRDLLKSMGLQPNEVEEVMRLIEKRRRQSMDVMTKLYRSSNITHGMVSDTIKQQKDLEKKITEEIFSQLRSAENKSIFEQWEKTRVPRRRIADLEVQVGRQFEPKQVELILGALNENSTAFIDLLKNNDDENLRKTIMNRITAKLGGTLSVSEVETLVKMHTTPKKRAQFKPE